MRCPRFPHIELIVLVSVIWVSAATSIHGAVDLGDSCFSMSSMSSVLWVRLDTGDLGDENATVVTADGHSCILPNRKIVKGSWGSEVVFEVTPDWRCHLPGDDIELRAKKGGGFISCHEEMHEAEAEVEVMVTYYNHVVATHAALFTTTTFTSSTSTTAVQPITMQSSIPHTTSSPVITPTNVNDYDSHSDHSKTNKSSSINRKHINFQINQGLLDDRYKKANTHLRRKTKPNKRNKNIEKDLGKEQDESESNMFREANTYNFLPPDYSQVTPEASMFTNTNRQKVYIHTTEKTDSWQFDSANPYQDDNFFSDSAANVNWERKPPNNIEGKNKKSSDIEILPNTDKEAPQDLSLFQFKDGFSLSTNEYIIIGAGSIIVIALLISATILIIVLKGKNREKSVDFWV